MQKSSIIRLSLCLLVIAGTLPMCAKQGPAGATGSQGPAGPQGPKGDTGTANVIYSQWIGGFSGLSANWSVPAITQGVIDSAAILVYADESGTLFQLPYDDINGSGFYLNDFISVGQIYLFCNNQVNLDAFTFRYMIIPGGVAVH